jgi:hypothetical protein
MVPCAANSNVPVGTMRTCTGFWGCFEMRLPGCGGQYALLPAAEAQRGHGPIFAKGNHLLRRREQ